MSEPYRRYLLGVFREHLPFAEVPIKLYLRRRQQGDERDEVERRPAKQVDAEPEVPQPDVPQPDVPQPDVVDQA